MAVWGVESLPIQADDIYRSSELPGLHRDPFDRLLISVALNRNLIVVTPDEWIKLYPVSTLW